jgi:hypothetical protein
MEVVNMRAWKLYKPYIRRINKKNVGSDIRTRIELALENVNYVLVHRRFPHKVIMTGKTKEEIKNKIPAINKKWDKFNHWANVTKRWSNKKYYAGKGYGKIV